MIDHDPFGPEPKLAPQWRPNQFAGNCVDCRRPVAAGAGTVSLSNTGEMRRGAPVQKWCVLCLCCAERSTAGQKPAEADFGPPKTI